MKKDPKILLAHIAESINLIERYVQGLDEAAFMTAPETQDAVARRLEIIGEASKAIDPEFKAQCPEVAWRETADLRNFLIHEYFGVSPKELWNILEKDLPLLKKQIRSLLEKEN
jgi:uncharacterized protein with HEPN domain